MNITITPDINALMQAAIIFLALSFLAILLASLLKAFIKETF